MPNGSASPEEEGYLPFWALRTYREGESGRERLLVYEIPQDALGTGSSLGNAKVWVNSKATGALERLFSLEIGESVAGSLVVRYGSPHRGLMPYSRVSTSGGGSGNADLGPPTEGRVKLGQTHPGIFRLHPAYQQRAFALPGNLDLTETLFVPAADTDDVAVVYQVIKVSNASAEPREVHVAAFANLRGTTPEDVRGSFDSGVGALLAWNESHPDWVRVLGFSSPASGYMTTHDVSRADDPIHLGPMTGETTACGSTSGAIEVCLRLRPGESRQVAVILAFTPEGRERALQLFRSALDFESALRDTVRHYQRLLEWSRLETPDRVINQGVQWCKANMRRVMGSYPVARAFTNEPGVSSHVVVRDVAWFVYGCDWLLPSFCREMLEATAARVYESGKVPEYFSALTGEVEDYGLNVNDGTPLFVLAAAHHTLATCAWEWLRSLYPVVVRAARYLLTQRDERGLVSCSARGQNVRGIASWRNVIPNYSINGAVTEVNALTHAALVAAAQMSLRLGEEAAAAEFRGAAAELREAINTHLVNPDNGMYYLNIDIDGNRHTDVTSDEVFPVMFCVAPDDIAFRIIARLNSPDFWTRAGLRVVSDQSPYYDPSTHVGLMGGVWPGVVFWYAFAAARYHPEFMVRGLREGYLSYLQSPRKNNTVPGQFSEWFDGESLVNRGMRLSPWEPPRYLWAAVEGLAGVSARSSGLSVDPRLPPQWKWLSVSRLPYGGGEVSFFVARESDGLRLYVTGPVDSPHAVVESGQDVTGEVRSWTSDASVLALRSGEELTVCVGNSADETLVVPCTLHGLLEVGSRYRVSVYNSEYGGWLDAGEDTGEALLRLAVSIERNGFYVLRFRPVSGAEPKGG